MEDLKASAERTGGKREEIEAELGRVLDEIVEKEQSLNDLVPVYEQHRGQFQVGPGSIAGDPAALDEAAQRTVATQR